jgi:hypothetical protein
VHPYDATHPQDIATCLLFHRPHILQFSGHGLKSGFLAFEREKGKTARVSFQSFTRLLTRSTSLHCVVLNACYTQPLAEAIAQHIDCVIGMHEDLSENTAEIFSHGFYQALASGESVGKAFRWACSEIELIDVSESLRPRIHWRPGVNPDALFLVPPPQNRQLA